MEALVDAFSSWQVNVICTLIWVGVSLLATFKIIPHGIFLIKSFDKSQDKKVLRNGVAFVVGGIWLIIQPLFYK